MEQSFTTKYASNVHPNHAKQVLILGITKRSKRLFEPQRAQPSDLHSCPQAILTPNEDLL
jgi:hypothetical protein